jgi:hypothetical protein
MELELSQVRPIHSLSPACQARGFQHHHHRRAVGVEAVFRLAYFALKGFEARGELTHFQLLGGGQAQLIGAARLDQIVGSTGLDGINGGIDCRMGGDNHYAHPWRLDSHLRQHIQAVVFAQSQVEETKVEDLALHQGIGLGRAVRSGNGVAFIFQAIAEGAEDRGLVIH